MRPYVIPGLILLTGILYIFVIPSDPEIVKILFKLIPMWLIIAYGIMNLSPIKPKHQMLMLIGLFFCMIGDGLMRWFVIGLTAFLIGHLFYIASFIRQYRYSLLRLLTLVPIAGYALIMGSKLAQELNSDGEASLIAPVIAYIAVISLMTWSAIMTGKRWVIVGSILFMISDSILSWNMFVSPVQFSNALIMITYYTAQFSMARSLLASDSARSDISATQNAILNK
jgi:alkenylglycerophosphocholine hydrolase